MTDFSYLDQLQVRKDQQATFTIYHIAGQPSLHVVPASEANKPYFNATLKRARKMAGAIRAGAINAELLDKNRSEDRDLYPKHVIVGWESIVDAKGKVVKFSKEACADFISALPNWIFDEVRDFAATPGNFVESSDIMDVEETAKN